MAEIPTDIIQPIKKYIAIKLSEFDMKYIFIKTYNDYLIQIAYRSPSIFLDGIYLTLPTEVIAASRLYHTHNHMQKIIIIKLNTSPIVNRWCDILCNLNAILETAVCGEQEPSSKPSASAEDSYIEKLCASSGYIAPPLKGNSRHEQFKRFIKKYTTKSGEELAMLIINNYNLDENHDTFSEQTAIPVVFYMKEINHHYNNYYCRTSLSYKNL